MNPKDIKLTDCFDAEQLREAQDRALHMRTVGGSCKDRRLDDELTHPGDMTSAGLTAGDLAALIEVALLYAPGHCFRRKTP